MNLQIYKTFACGAKKEDFCLKDPPKFLKFSPAALNEAVVV